MMKKISELEIGEFFVFVTDQADPFFKVGNGYISVSTEGYYNNERKMDTQVATVTREYVHSLLFRYDMSPEELTKIVREGLEEFPSPSYWTRAVYFFECHQCKGKTRRSYDIESAASGVCRKCRIANKKNNDGQLSLIPLPEDNKWNELKEMIDFNNLALEEAMGLVAKVVKEDAEDISRRMINNDSDLE